MKYVLPVFFLLLLLPEKNLRACKCADHLPLDKAQFELYDVIFTGRLDSVSVCYKGYATGYFRVQKLYKGKCYDQVAVRFDCETDCQLNLLKGEEWLIYSRYYQYDRLGVEFCSRSRKHIVQGDDFYRTLNHLTWKEELAYLDSNPGIHELLKKEIPALKERQLIIPGAYRKLGLLLVSFICFIMIFYFVKKLP